MKCKKQSLLTCPIDATGESACLMVSFSGIYEALDLLYQLMRSVLYRRIAMTIKMASKAGVLCIVVLFLIVALEATGAIQSE